MAETEQPPPEAQSQSPAHASFSVWPPSDRTREAIRSRLIENLSSPSILSKRYGTVPRDEAEELAKKMEEEAFEFSGNNSVDDGGSNDGIEILQVYSKEISRKMLDTVKSRSSGGAAAADVKEEDDVGPPHSEKTESVAADD